METHEKLLEANKNWVAEKLKLQPDYFKKLAGDQNPEFLWIGCSDSRVPAEEITGTQPGEIFVHRNVANLVVHTDFNLLSVLQYAVEFLKVKHIILCGHYGCGGVRFALTQQSVGFLNQWLRYIKDVFAENQTELLAIESDDERWKRLVELNVLEQVQNLARTSIVQKAWGTGQDLSIHGWVYGLNDGFIKDLTRMDSDSTLNEIYRFNWVRKNP